MLKLSASILADFTAGEHIPAIFLIPISGFSIDSRTIKPGEIFIAIKGKNFDGHNFIQDAARKGASGFIIERANRNTCQGVKGGIILVNNTYEAIGLLARKIRELVKTKVICVTGSNGKTTVKDILSFILSRKLKVLKSEKSYNNHIGLCLTLFELDTSYDVAVLELGSNHPGEIPLLAQIAQPNIAIIANIGNGHLEGFGDKAGVFTEKTSVLNFLSPGGIAFVNRDDDYLARLSGYNKINIKFYGMDKKSDFVIDKVIKEVRGYNIFLDGEKFSIPFEGLHNVYNAAAAICVSKYLGVESSIIQERISLATLPKMRLERINMGDIVFINDAYNANPDSFECALKVLCDMPWEGKKGVVAGDMLELGNKSRDFHKMIGRSIAEKGIDFLIVMGRDAKYILEGARDFGMGKEHTSFAGSYDEAAKTIREFSDTKTVVLVKGSRANRMEEIFKCFMSYSTL